MRGRPPGSLTLTFVRNSGVERMVKLGCLGDLGVALKISLRLWGKEADSKAP